MCMNSFNELCRLGAPRLPHDNSAWQPHGRHYAVGYQINVVEFYICRCPFCLLAICDTNNALLLKRVGRSASCRSTEDRYGS